MEGIVKLIASTTMKRGEVGILVDGSGPNGTVGRVYKNTGGSHKYGGQRVMALDNCFPGEKSRFSYLDDLVTYIGVPSGGKRGNPVYIDEDAGLLSLSLPTNGVFVGDIAHGNVARLNSRASTSITSITTLNDWDVAITVYRIAPDAGSDPNYTWDSARDKLTADGTQALLFKGEVTTGGFTPNWWSDISRGFAELTVGDLGSMTFTSARLICHDNSPATYSNCFTFDSGVRLYKWTPLVSGVVDADDDWFEIDFSTPYSDEYTIPAGYNDTPSREDGALVFNAAGIAALRTGHIAFAFAAVMDAEDNPTWEHSTSVGGHLGIARGGTPYFDIEVS